MDRAPPGVCHQEGRSEALLAPPADHLGDRPLTLVLGRAGVEIIGCVGAGLRGCPGVPCIALVGADMGPPLVGKPLEDEIPVSPLRHHRQLLDFSCATYESARQVAMAGGWEHRVETPSDCRFLMGQRIENRIATILEIIEVVQLPSGRWAKIGRVRRLFGPISYSAGLADEYPGSVAATVRKADPDRV